MFLSDLTEQAIKTELNTITKRLEALDMEQRDAEQRIVLAYPDPALLSPLESQLSALADERRAFELVEQALRAELPHARARDLLADWQKTRDKLDSTSPDRERENLESHLNRLAGQLHARGIDTRYLPDEVKRRLMAEYKDAKDEEAAMARWGEIGESGRHRAAERKRARADRLATLGVNVAALDTIEAKQGR